MRTAPRLQTQVRQTRQKKKLDGRVNKVRRVDLTSVFSSYFCRGLILYLRLFVCFSVLFSRT